MADDVKVLFVCVHNSGRSQMAEAFFMAAGGNGFKAESAGFKPTELNPLVVEVMREAGLDISANKSKSVFDFFRQGRLYDYVVTVCDDTEEKECPIFPGLVKRMHMPFTDPAGVTGDADEKLDAVRRIRDDIKDRIESWVTELKG